MALHRSEPSPNRTGRAPSGCSGTAENRPAPNAERAGPPVAWREWRRSARAGLSAPCLPEARTRDAAEGGGVAMEVLAPASEPVPVPASSSVGREVPRLPVPNPCCAAMRHQTGPCRKMWSLTLRNRRCEEWRAANLVGPAHDDKGLLCGALSLQTPPRAQSLCGEAWMERLGVQRAHQPRSSRAVLPQGRKKTTSAELAEPSVLLLECLRNRSLRCSLG